MSVAKVNQNSKVQHYDELKLVMMLRKAEGSCRLMHCYYKNIECSHFNISMLEYSSDHYCSCEYSLTEHGCRLSVWILLPFIRIFDEGI